MTRTQSILTGALLALAALAPVLTAHALGSLETRSAVAGACLDAPRVEVTKVVQARAEPNSCSADGSSEVRP